MNDSNQRLTRTQGADYFFADRLLPDSSNQRFDRRQRNVGLQQSEPDLAQSISDIIFGEACLTAQRLHDAGKTLGQVIEHLASSLV